MARLRGALANNTVFIVLNRRMRIRTYGGVRGVELLPAYSITFDLFYEAAESVSESYFFNLIF